MATLSLKISIEGGKVVKTIQFEPSTTVYDACRIIREKILEASAGDPKEYGLFLASEEDNKKGIWLEASRSLDYYMLRNGDLLEYNKKTRNLRVRMLDGTVKTLLVDDSQIVANLMVVICTKIGITNYDEYGLVREEQKDECDPCEKPNYGTLTLKRRHQEKERDAKMEQLRKKLRTDDEVNWVEPSKTLREQGVEATETLLLRRKLFFSDRNVDSRDPVQLTLLYVQARDAIVDGTHPVTQDKACEFAGIQCQIQFGDHREDKHMPGFLDLKEFLPASYVKVKNIEKKVLKEHRRHATLSELDAKVLYTKSARELPTYGVAFFLVKEKMKGKNKLVPRLLGVTKDSVLRLDEKTKEILQSWPLTTVRRWCASPNTFTLDFGDYSDQYYSVQTTEAEQILQVIAGYIDIIVRKQRAKEHLGIDGDEGSAMLEDSVSPSKANIIQHDTFKSGKVNTESVAKPAVHRPGAEGAKPFAVGHITGAQQTTVSGQIITGHTPPAAGQSQHTQVTSLSTEPQRALLSTISTGTQLIKKAQEELVMAELPELGSDAASIKWKQVTLDSNKQVVTSQIAAMNAATAQVVTLTSGPQEAVDHTAVGAAITSITTNLPHVTRGVGLLAALLPANGDSLLSATKRLCTAFTDLLKAAEPDTDEPRQSLLNAASRVGEASTTVLHTIEDNEEDRETQDILLSLAKSVANTTAALVLKAKNVAAQCKNDQQLQNNIIAAATNCALATSQLVACAKVVAPTLQNPACREQLECAARQVAAGVRRLVDASAAAPDAPAHSGLAAAATRVSDELQRLLDHAQQARAPPTGVDVETVLTRSERVVLAPSPHEMVRHARLLGQATAVLITDIKTEAERQPSENQRKLLAAAKLLADATARMVEAARQCASEPQDPEKQAALRAAAEELRYIAADYATGTERVHDHVYKLQETSLQAASSATQLITSAQNAAQYNTNKHAQESFSEECRSLHSVIPPMVEAAHAWTQHGGAAKQLDLVSASEAFLQRSGDIMMSARSCVPTVQDASAARHLADTTQQYADDCSSLRTSVSRVRSSSHGLELDAAAEILRSLEEDFRELEEAARACQLRPLPGQTEEWSMSAMSVSSRGLCSSAAQLVSAARGGAGQGRAAGELARHAREFSGAVRAAAASRPQGQDRVVSHGRHVVQSSLTLVETVQRYITSSEPLHAASLVQIANDISKGLESTMEAMPSQSELDEVLENINETLNILNMGDLPPSDRTYGALQSSLSTAAAELSACACAVPEAVDSRPALSAAAARYGDSFNNTMQAAMEMAHHTQDREAQTVMVSSMKSVTINSSKLLSTAKSISQDLSRPNGKNQLTAAVRAVTESINKLVDVCTEAGPGVKQCAAALRSVAALAPLLRPAADPLSDLTYYECLDHVVDHSKALSEGMSGMANAIKRSEQEQFGSSVTGVAAAVTGLVEVTAQAAYLVGASHPASSAGRAGLVDQAQFARAAAAIRAACTTLADPATDQHQVLSAATAVARHTSSLCNACRAASARSASPQDKRTFVTAAKDVANCTATLVKEIKALDKDYTEANRQRCAAATGPLQDAVRSLCQFADSPDFASVPAKISPEGRQQQEVILDCGRNIQSGSVSMLEAARALGAAPGERAQWQALATHSKHVSDTIKALVTNIREQAPGQRECAAACDTLAQQIRVLDRAELQAVSQQAAPPPNNTLEGYCSQVESCATEMLERVEPLRAAATGHAEHLGHAVSQLVSYAAPLVEAGVGCSRRLAASSAPGSVLAHTRTVLEASGSLVQAAAASAGNPRATSAHATVESTATTVRAGLSELREAARALAARAGAVGPLLDTLTRATNTLTEHRMSLVGSYDENDSFVDYQTRMVGTAKDIARLATDMTAKSATDPSKLLDVANELCQNYESLAHDSVGAVATTPQADTAARIRNCVVDVGEAVKSLVRAGADCRLAPAPHSQSEVGQAAKVVGEKVVSVLSALQSCSQGTQACIDAAANIANIISDLDTTILFASAGTLQSEVECEQFSDHRELILKTAKRLVEDTKALVGGAAGQQDQLAAAATAANDTITSLVQVVKGGALALGAHSPESQVVVLHAARDVAAALRDLAAATTAASGRHHHHPHMQRLKHAAKRSDPKRWSLPVKHNARQTVSRRLSVNVKNDTSCDSETDMFQSDQEEELIKLLDYSSQDDDVSPSIFHDNCEDIISYIESLMTIPVKTVKNDDLNERYNLAARNSLVDMDWRVLKYGENIFLGEVKKLVDFTVDVFERVNKRNRIEVIKRLKAANVLDNEMKRLSQVIEDIDLYETNEVIITTETVVKNVVLNENNVKHENNAKIEVNGNGKRKIEDEKQTEETIDLNDRIKSPIFRIKKVKPITLEPNFESVSPDVIKSPTSVNGDTTDSPNTIQRKVKMEFWKMFQDDSEWWKALAQRNLDKMEETRRELERFSGHELVLGEIQSNLNKYDKEKETLEMFIEEVDRSKETNTNVEYSKKYEGMILKLIDFAKKDFIYKGFDPLIEQLKYLSTIQFDGPKRINVEEIIKMYTQIDISKYTYEELCVLENYYQEIIKNYKKINDKENTEPVFNKNVILNINTVTNTNKNINQYSNTTTQDQKRNTTTKNNRNNLEIFDLTRTYPMEYYANNWWTIYEDILKNREQQFGSIDQWWSFYESILNNKDTTKADLERIKTIMALRSKRRPNSRMEEQLKMLDGVKNDRFQETEYKTRDANESVMVTNVTSLLKTVKAVEDEHTRGLRALESTIEAISQEIEALSSPAAAAPCSPEELVRRTRHMTAATAGAVAAAHSHSQDTLTAAANQGRRTVLDLLHAVKGAAQECECLELRARTLAAGRAAGESFRAVLLAVLAAVPDPAQRQLLPERSRAVAATVADIIALAEQLKGSDWVDPSDPTVIAEHELLGAAASIDAAAKKLESLRPRKPIQETDENMNFDEMILEAAKSIIAATSALVRAASAAQRELIDQGKVARRPAMSSDDGQWSEGLVSAARLVAAAAHALVEAANALVCGHASEERLVSAARHVAATTAHLLVACKVKADPSSESTRRLQAAGGAVLRSTDGLVRAARDAITDHEERSLVLNRRMVGGIAQEIDARTEVLRIEKELEEARGRLTAIRQAKYKLKTADGGEDTDTDGADYARLKSPTSFINTTYSPNSTYSPHITQNITNLSSHISQLNQTVGSPYSPTNQNAQTPTNHSASYANQTGLTNQGSNLSTNQMYDRNGSYSQNSMRDEKQYTVQSGSFSSFRPQDETPKQNYEGFTSRYETRLYDTPRPVNEYSKTERHDNQYYSKQEQMFNYEAPKSPLSPKFNARELKFDEPIYSSLKKPLDGLGQTFSEHQKSTEAIPGGTKHSEYSIKSESYQSFPKTEYSKIETREEVKSPFTSTPKIDRTEIKNSSTELVKAVTPDYDRIASPYGKEVHSYGGPNFMEETTTEVKEIPNGTQKITTTKIYSSSPVNITSTNTKYEPIKLEGIDELSKAFDNDSKYSTLDSRFNTLESKLSSDTSRSFMRPSDFQSSDYQTTTSVTKVKKPAELSKELDTLDKKFSKQTVTSETIERKSVMTSSHKSETSSTVTKKFGNF